MLSQIYTGSTTFLLGKEKNVEMTDLVWHIPFICYLAPQFLFCKTFSQALYTAEVMKMTSIWKAIGYHIAPLQLTQDHMAHSKHITYKF